MDDKTPADGSRADVYAFMNHSPASVHDNQPPNIDDKRVARQKRKRTSQEDQAILEAAYQSDPKPDKAARLELVNQVALGEKEVQIWFQNRRQSSRRKSRPLLPHEVAQYQMSRAGIPASSLSSSIGSAGSDHDHDTSFDNSSLRTPEDPASSFAHAEPKPTMTEASLSGSAARNSSTQSAQGHAGSDEAPTTNSRSSFPSPAVVTSGHLSEHAPSIGYLSNRRSASSVREAALEHNAPATISLVGSHRTLKKSASLVRLSMNAEGKAEIVTKDASSPSPPRPQNNFILPDPSVASSDAPTSDARCGQGLHRSSSGRSRDSRAWEFWCDRESRSELGNAAEKDASGSATGAIGILRTVSGRNVLGSVPSKRNSLAGHQGHPAKRSKLDQKRAPLQRSSTSQGRLQGKPGQTVPKLKHSGSANYIRIAGNDSDKENWSPTTDGGSEGQDRDSDMRRSGTHASHGTTGRRALAETVNAGGKASKSRKQRIGDGASEVTDPENDGELAAFMRSGTKSASAGDDMDCVQGLLSLSQGNWR